MPSILRLGWPSSVLWGISINAFLTFYVCTYWSVLHWFSGSRLSVCTFTWHRWSSVEYQGVGKSCPSSTTLYMNLSSVNSLLQSHVWYMSNTLLSLPKSFNHGGFLCFDRTYPDGQHNHVLAASECHTIVRDFCKLNLLGIHCAHNL